MMAGLLARVASRLLARATVEAKRAAHLAGLATIALLCALVALGFATGGVYILLRAAYGATLAAFMIAAAYGLLALVIAGYVALANHDAPTAAGTVRDAKQTLVDELRRNAGSDRERMALMAGAQIARDLRPMHMLLLSVAAGFVAGGWLDRKKPD